MRYAVIGSGIAGISVGYLLSLHKSEDVEVTIYEKSASLGMDAHSRDVMVDDDASKQQKSIRIDMPLRVFTETYYPHLTSLYEEVGIQYAPEDYSASFTSLDGTVHFGYRNFIFGTFSIPYMVAPLTNLFRLSSWRIVRDLLYFLVTAPRHLRSGRLGPAIDSEECCNSCSSPRSSSSSPSCPTVTSRLTFKQYLLSQGYSADFMYKMIIPTLAGILTCSHEAVEAYPAYIVIHYLATRSMRGVRRVVQGTQQVVNTLTKNCDVRCNAGVQTVTPILSKDGKSTIGVSVTDSQGRTDTYDHVIFACQANQAWKMLGETSDPNLRTALQGIKYEKSHLVTHTDVNLMPKNRECWKPVNFILPDTCFHDSNPGIVPIAPTAIHEQGMATIWLNAAQTTIPRTVRTQIFQTWNPLIAAAPNTILQSDDFERPIVNYESLQCITQLWKQHQGKNHLWFCGSYAHCGMPLLETAVSSAVRITELLGYECPWTQKVQQKLAKFQRHKQTSSMSFFTSLLPTAFIFLILALLMYSCIAAKL